MYLHIPGLLNTETLQKIDELVGAATFVEGNLNAGPLTKPIKNNLQLDRENSPQVQELDTLVVNALWRSPHLRAAALPLKMTPPLIARYDQGMSYGLHSDNPVTGRGTSVRTDLTAVVFLSDPDSYKGGLLTLRTELGDINFRLPRGDVLVFPSGIIRSLSEVTEGRSTLATLWIQSMVQDTGRRQTLFELDRACTLVGEKSPQSEESRLLLKVYGNLVRMWGEA